MTEVQVTVARADQADVIANLMQLYVHDFSELFAGTDRGELEADGRFAVRPLLEGYWEQQDHVALLIRAGDRLAGFALLNATSHSGLPADRNVAEFFVARKYRRCGVGAAAAQAIFSRYPGLWEAAVARRNVAALPFWRFAAAGHPQGSEITEADYATEGWNGPILRFRIGVALS